MRLMMRMMVATHLFTSRAASGICRSRRSCSTEAALRLMRRMVMARHLFTSRAAKGFWRSRRSYSTEAALRLMRRMIMARHLCTPRAAGGIWRPRPSCWPEVALLTKASKRCGPTVMKSWIFCRRGWCQGLRGQEPSKYDPIFGSSVGAWSRCASRCSTYVRETTEDRQTVGGLRPGFRVGDFSFAVVRG